LSNIEQFSLENIFSFIISGDDVKKQKPHPEGLIKAIDKTKAKPNEILYVDDMKTIFIEAKKLGMTTVGFKSKINDDLSSADYLIERMDEILKII